MRRYRRLGARQRLGHGEQPRDDALDIAVPRDARLVEGDGRDRRRRIGSNAGKPEQLRFAGGKAPAMFLGDDLGAGVQIAGARVIAKPRPGGEDIFERRLGQRLDARPARHEFAEISRDARHRRLLQHDFRQPDRVRVRRPSRRRAPRENPAMAVPPRQQRAAEIVGGGGLSGLGGSARHGSGRLEKLKFVIA